MAFLKAVIALLVHFCVQCAAQQAERVSTSKQLQSALRAGASNIVVEQHIALDLSAGSAGDAALPAVQTSTRSIRVRFKGSVFKRESSAGACCAGASETRWFSMSQIVFLTR